MENRVSNTFSGLSVLGLLLIAVGVLFHGERIIDIFSMKYSMYSLLGFVMFCISLTSGLVIKLVRMIKLIK